jgi:hypothetical protein
LALDVAQLAGQRIGLPIDRLKLLAVAQSCRLQRADVVFGEMQLPGVDARRRQPRSSAPAASSATPARG